MNNDIPVRGNELGLCVLTRTYLRQLHCANKVPEQCLHHNHLCGKVFICTYAHLYVYSSNSFRIIHVSNIYPWKKYKGKKGLSTDFPNKVRSSAHFESLTRKLND